MSAARFATSSRRSVLTGRGVVIRPPWSTEASVMEKCTSCGDCVAACPEAILVPGPGRTPVVDFRQGECTFCGRCAETCAEAVFTDVSERPWTLVASIDPGCMMTSGISCQLCRDSCEEQALRLDFTQRPVGRIVIKAEACTGCGACLATCPVDAITLSPNETANV